MKALDDSPYTPEIVAAVFEAWPNIRTGAENGSLEIKTTTKRERTIEEKIALEALGAMTPRGKRANNTFYTIDNPMSIIVDIDTAMKAVLSERMIQMLYRRFYLGYKLEDVAAMYGITFAAVKSACDRAFVRIADHLERPATRKVEPELPPRTSEAYPHSRKYADVA